MGEKVFYTDRPAANFVVNKEIRTTTPSFSNKSESCQLEMLISIEQTTPLQKLVIITTILYIDYVVFKF